MNEILDSYLVELKSVSNSILQLFLFYLKKKEAECDGVCVSVCL